MTLRNESVHFLCCGHTPFAPTATQSKSERNKMMTIIAQPDIWVLHFTLHSIATTRYVS
jgi:hypothetical protein